MIHERINHQHIDHVACKKLWSAVVLMNLTDAVGKAGPERADAQRWLLSQGPASPILEQAGIDPQAFNKAVRRLEAGGWVKTWGLGPRLGR